MKRRSVSEIVEPWRARINETEAHQIAAELEQWAVGVTGITWPDMPDGVQDRAADVWEALLVIADLAGGEWPRRARNAAVAMITGEAKKPNTIGVQLLMDLRTVFHTDDRMATDNILHELRCLPESPWIDSFGKYDARWLADQLDRYEIAPKQLRIGGEKRRGYDRGDFSDAWERYLPVPS
jgi:hypothetical protein